jgi:hypothetical protein
MNTCDNFSLSFNFYLLKTFVFLLAICCGGVIFLGVLNMDSNSIFEKNIIFGSISCLLFCVSVLFAKQKNIMQNLALLGGTLFIGFFLFGAYQDMIS